MRSLVRASNMTNEGKVGHKKIPKHAGASQGPSQRQLRVGESLRHVIADALMRGDLHHLALGNVSITVSEVQMSPDLRHATAYVTPLGGGDEARIKAILSALTERAPQLRHIINQQLRLKFSPNIHFRYDHSFDEAARMGALFHKEDVARDLQRPHESTTSDDDA